MGFPAIETAPLHDALHDKANAGATPKTFKTGHQYEDEGPACEREPPSGTCVLDPKNRGRLEEEISRVSAYSLGNYHAALGNARVDLLMKKDGGIGFIGELALGALSSTLVGGLGLLAGKIAERAVVNGIWSGAIASADFDVAISGHKTAFASTIKEVVTAAKTPLKQTLVGYSRESVEQGHLLQLMQNSASGALNKIVVDAKSGDDAVLLLAREALDPNRLTVEAFQIYVDDLISRFAASHLDQLGTTKTGPVEDGDRHVVRFISGSRSRLAVVDVRQVKLLGRSHGDDWYSKGGSKFVSWIDEDLDDAATDAQSRHGTGKIESIDVLEDHSWDAVDQVWTWKFGGVR